MIPLLLLLFCCRACSTNKPCYLHVSESQIYLKDIFAVTLTGFHSAVLALKNFRYSFFLFSTCLNTPLRKSMKMSTWQLSPHLSTPLLCPLSSPVSPQVNIYLSSIHQAAGLNPCDCVSRSPADSGSHRVRPSQGH